MALGAGQSADSRAVKRCYLCGERRPAADTEVSRYTVPSAARGGTVQGVSRYVRMCRNGYGCKAAAPSILDPCPTCQDKGVVFYETALRMVPCPTCRPGDHKEALRAV